MNIKDFVAAFAEQFDDIPRDEFAAATRFKENDEWSSMTALSIIAMAEDHYAVNLTGEDIRKAITIEDVFHMVSEKANG